MGKESQNAKAKYKISEPRQLVYVVRKPGGQKLLSPEKFATKYGWKNDPGKVKLPEESLANGLPS